MFIICMRVMNQELFFEKLCELRFSESADCSVTADDLLKGIPDKGFPCPELFLYYDQCNAQMMDLSSLKELEFSEFLDFSASRSIIPTVNYDLPSDLFTLDTKLFVKHLDEVACLIC